MAILEARSGTPVTAGRSEPFADRLDVVIVFSLIAVLAFTFMAIAYWTA